ncbi:MAG: GNAT family N-acetyltransferase [Richelia sp. RM2_1_2]|nr:GNAT family N-acetyltransferase [Richelia sp. RM1_1_1]NJO63032.1 GNAT family N-acetyltransferase [Richelia sp. RM2_1_2]
MNTFRYRNAVTTEFESSLFLWYEKCQEYLRLYYAGNRENARGTSFWSCISKIEFLIENPGNYRGVQDNQELMQAIATIEIQEIDVEEIKVTGLAIESFVNAPWNVIEQIQPERRRGSATSLIEEIIKESQACGFGGIVKAMTIPQARPFYKRIGFIETNGSGEMILSREAATRFLLEQEQRRQFQP